MVMFSAPSIANAAVMAFPRPKSPRPAPISAKKEDKEESFWDKIGTLGRKKRIKEGKFSNCTSFIIQRMMTSTEVTYIY